MRVRDALPADAGHITRFNVALAQESEGKALDETVLRRGVERALARPALCRYFMAEIDREVVGQTMLTYEWSDWRDGVIWWIQSVYVLPEARRRGVFRALFDHIERLSRETPDVAALRLYVERDNERARRTYATLGMEQTGYLVYERGYRRNLIS
jgi:ribosomal protein S18 acetylase RimI-like enzyme